jgi:hypothetical protein
MIFKLKKLRFYFFSAIFISASVLGCNNKYNGTSTGNPKVAFAATGSSSNVIASVKNLRRNIWNIFFNEAIALPPPPSILDSAGHNVVLSNFWINFGNIEFETTQNPTSGEIDGSDIVIAGPLTVDLLSTNPTVFGPFALVSSTFKRLKYKSANLLVPNSNSPAGLKGNSIYLNGTLNGSTFSVQISDQVEVEVGGPNAVVAQDGARLLLQISTISIFSKINMTALVGAPTAITSTNRIAQANACPLIDSSAADLYTCFLGAIAPESNVGEDINLDFQIDNNEPAIK